MLDLETHGAIFGPPFVPTGRKKTMVPEDVQRDSSSSSPPSANTSSSSSEHTTSAACGSLHIPYADLNLPFTCKTSRCAACGKGRVPDVLFATTEPPAGLDITGRGCLVQAKVLRLKKDLKGEQNAKEISDGLPFIEYEMHRRLMNKLKVKGMNCLFGLKTKVSIGDRTIIGTATATACFLAALPVPNHPKLAVASGTTWHNQDAQALARTQKRLEDRIAENEEFYGLLNHETRRQKQLAANDKDDHDMIDDNNLVNEADFSAGNKDTCVLEIDDSEDTDILESLLDPFPPPRIQVFSTEELVGVPAGHVVKSCQTFSQVWRGRIHPSSRDLATACQRLLTGIYFKLRRQRPCLVSNVNYQAELDEENELQLCIYGTAITLEEVVTPSGSSKLPAVSSSNREAIKTEVDRSTEPGNSDDQKSIKQQQQPAAFHHQKFYSSVRDRKAIQVTPLSYIPGARVNKHLGNLNFFLIRETSSLKETGGLNNFIQAFLSEVFSLVRAHVRALGGNALVGYFMSEFVVNHSPYKNQGQCLLHVGGDVVSVTYQTLKQQQQPQEYSL